jgi:phosphoglycerate dehydrogenase-like enzyme
MTRARTILAWIEPNSLWQEQVEVLHRRLPEAEVVLTNDREAPALPRAQIIIGKALPAEVIDAARDLELLAVALAGINHLPLELLRKRNVRIVNAHANGRFVAERVLALTLGFTGRLVQFHRDLEQGRWHGFAAGESVRDSWSSIRGKRVVLLGTGSIGFWTARLFKAFECTTVGFRRTVSRPEDPFDEISTDLESAVTGADIVVCTLPLTDATRGLVSERVFSAMEGALFVNVGRGPVADEQALYNALVEGIITGAAIDTWYQYPEGNGEPCYPSRFPMHTLDNVLLSPHLGGYTPEATRASLEEVVEKVARYVESGTITGEVDPLHLY